MKTVERFWSKVEKTETCWLWIAPTTVEGYGTFGIGSRTDGTKRVVGAHRFAYELLVGPIPDGMELDHVKELCGNRHCVNPAHLEPVVHKVNINRGKNARSEKTHCPQGHEYAGDNLYISSFGFRQCRACGRERHRLSYNKQKEAIYG